MHKIKFQNYRLRAEQIEIIYPQHDFDSEKPLEYDIYANGIRLGNTTNRVLNFKSLLQSAYEHEIQWRDEVNEARERGSEVMPEPPQSQAQMILMVVNECPNVDEPLRESTNKCWNSVNMQRINDWIAVPFVNEEEMIEFENQAVVGELK